MIELRVPPAYFVQERKGVRAGTRMKAVLLLLRPRLLRWSPKFALEGAGCSAPSPKLKRERYELTAPRCTPNHWNASVGAVGSRLIGLEL